MEQSLTRPNYAIKYTCLPCSLSPLKLLLYAQSFFLNGQNVHNRSQYSLNNDTKASFAIDILKTSQIRRHNH